MMQSIGIDIGTTTISLVVLDRESGVVLESRTIVNGTDIDTGREWESVQDADRIVHKAQVELDALLDAHDGIATIGLTGQMHGIVYVNGEGAAVSPLYTWKDGRGDLRESGVSSDVQESGCPGNLRESVGSGNVLEHDGRSLVERLREETGLALATGFGLVTHLYHLRHGQVPMGAVRFCTIADYLGMQLTGRRTPRLHASNAASLGFYDAVNGAFRRDLLEQQGVDCSILPEVTSSFETMGTYRGIPVTVAIGDNQASYLGAVGMRENAVLLNMGTGGQISVLSPAFYEAPGIEARPLAEGRYLLVGASLCGGRAYAILEQFLRSYVAAYEMSKRSGVDGVLAAADRGLNANDDATATDGADSANDGMRDGHDANHAVGGITGGHAVDNLASTPPQYEIMECLARAGMHQRDPMQVSTLFQGTRLDPTHRGSIVNISEDNFTPEGLIYGTLEGMVRELYDLYHLIEEGAGIHVATLVGSGNGLRRNPVLQEICTQMFGVPLQLSPYEEEAACGAALCGPAT